MSLRNVMRKAAGLLLEMPPEDQAPETSDNVADNSTRDNTMRDNTSRPAPDVDALLAAVRGPKTDEKAGKSATDPASMPTTATATQVAQSGTGPNLSDIKSAAAGAAQVGMQAGDGKSEKTVIVGADGKVNLPVIYELAGVPATNFTAEQALEIINSLPSDLPLEVRRQTVKATLNAIGKTVGATPQTIVGDATRKLAALEAYLESFGQKSEEFTKKVEADIVTLEAQIQDRRKAIENAHQRVQELSSFCDGEAARLDDVLEFFSLDVGPSKYATGNATGNAAGNQDSSQDTAAKK